MRPRVDVSFIVGTAVGKLSADVESSAVETTGGAKKNTTTSSDKHLKIINGLPPELIDRVGNVLQSLNPHDSLIFLREIAKKHPARFTLLIKNDIIASRMQHTKKIAELCAILDLKRAEKIRATISALKRNIFEIESKYRENDTHSKIIENISTLEDEDEKEDED